VNRGLKSVRDSGGVPQWLTHNEGDPNVLGHIYPRALSDGKSLLFTAFALTGFEASSLAALSFKTGQWKVVLPHADLPQYASTGHLLFYHNGRFDAARFDVKRLQVVGPRVPVLQSSLFPALSDAGCLVHGPPPSGATLDGRGPARPLVWVNRLGETQRWKSPTRSYRELRLSPDGKHLAASVFGNRGRDIWILDLERESELRLTFEGINSYPSWTPDGKHVIFSSSPADNSASIFSASADGSGRPQQLASGNLIQAQGAVSPDGRILAFTQVGSAATGFDIYTVSLKDGGAVKPLIQTESAEGFPAFSPDGRWLAYHSDETGPREVFVQPYPPTAAKWQISDQGGSKPRWSAKGDELFYRDGPRLYAVPIETEPTFKSGRPKLLFEKPFVGSPTRSDYDVSPDGERFVFMEMTEEEAARKSVQQLIVVQNWFEELDRLAPPQSSTEQPAR
jgi:hypothetical protein